MMWVIKALLLLLLSFSWFKEEFSCFWFVGSGDFDEENDMVVVVEEESVFVVVAAEKRLWWWCVWRREWGMKWRFAILVGTFIRDF